MVRGMVMPIWYHPLYTEGISEGARFPRERYRILRERLKALEEEGSVIIECPEPIGPEVLKISHEESYVDRFLEGTLTQAEIRRIGLQPWTDSFVERTLRIMGGSVSALEHVLVHGGLSGNLAGGTHHSHRDFGSGYCVFNDLSVCALLARDYHGCSRVVVLDLDVHQGDGTASILEEEEGVTTISVHCKQNFPFRKAESDYDLVVEAGSGDDEYLSVIDDAMTIVERYEPDVILFQAGVDGLSEDALGRLDVSREGMRYRNKKVFDYVLDRQVPCVVFMGGGYSDPIEHTVDALMDLFRGAANVNSLLS